MHEKEKVKRKGFYLWRLKEEKGSGKGEVIGLQYERLKTKTYKVKAKEKAGFNAHIRIRRKLING